MESEFGSEEILILAGVICLIILAITVITLSRSVQRQKHQIRKLSARTAEEQSRAMRWFSQRSSLETQVELLRKDNSVLNQKNAELEKTSLQRTTDLFLNKQVIDSQKSTIEELENRVLYLNKVENLGSLLFGVTHDFSNILGIIVSHAAIMRKSESIDPSSISRIDAILRSAQRGSTLIQQLVNVARSDESCVEHVDANSLVEELREFLHAVLPASMTFTSDLAENLPTIKGDSTMIYQAMLNLCINARDAMPEGGEITVSTSRVSGLALRASFNEASADEYVRIRISDTGIGIDEGLRSRIFDPFFTTKEPGKGTGLGLAITQRAVKKHDGFIHLESTSGVGSSFSMYLPSSDVPLAHVPRVAAAVEV